MTATELASENEPQSLGRKSVRYIRVWMPDELEPEPPDEQAVAVEMLFNTRVPVAKQTSCCQGTADVEPLPCHYFMVVIFQSVAQQGTCVPPRAVGSGSAIFIVPYFPGLHIVNPTVAVGG